MALLSEDKLIWSPIVANSRMNRERNATGVNSYEQEIKFKPEDFLQGKIDKYGSASWMDLCCGQGKALIQTAEYFCQKGLQDQLKLTGVDLTDHFSPINSLITCLQFHTTSLMDFRWNDKYDLITCVHGLHYAGDKLKAIEHALAALTPWGFFVANLDPADIVIEGSQDKNVIKSMFKVNGIRYDSRQKILMKEGHAEVRFNCKYLGADDSRGPNYTGQDSVTSFYRI